MSNPSDLSDDSLNSTTLTPSVLTVVTESLSSRPSETTPSTEQPKNRVVLFQPGQSGNPAGRPKGTKNQITILKQVLELELRTRSRDRIHKVLDKAFDLAERGDRLMIKLLLELHMSKQLAQDDESGGKSQVAVVIQNLTQEVKTPLPVVKTVKELTNE